MNFGTKAGILLLMLSIAYAVNFLSLNSIYVYAGIPLASSAFFVLALLLLLSHWRFSPVWYPLLMTLVAGLMLLAAEAIKFLNVLHQLPYASQIYYLYAFSVIPASLGLAAIIKSWKEELTFTKKDYVVSSVLVSVAAFIILYYFTLPPTLQSFHFMGYGYMILLLLFLALFARVILKRFLCTISPYMFILGASALLIAHSLAPLKLAHPHLVSAALTYGYVILALSLLMFIRECQEYSVKALMLKHPSLIKPEVAERLKSKHRIRHRRGPY